MIKILQYATAFSMLLFALMSPNQMAFAAGGLRGSVHSMQKGREFHTTRLDEATGVGDGDYTFFLYKQSIDGHLARELFNRNLAMKRTLIMFGKMHMSRHEQCIPVVGHACW